MYYLGKLCIPKGERVHVIREAHTSLVSGHFGVEKILCHVQIFCFWPHMKNIVTHYVKGCVMCSVSKHSNRKLGLYTPLLILNHPWESVSMDLVGGFPLSRKIHDYLYVVVHRFSKMCNLMPCKKKITAEQTAYLFFSMFGSILGCPHRLCQINTLALLESFGPTCGR